MNLQPLLIVQSALEHFAVKLRMMERKENEQNRPMYVKEYLTDPERKKITQVK